MEEHPYFWVVQIFFFLILQIVIMYHITFIIN